MQPSYLCSSLNRPASRQRYTHTAKLVAVLALLTATFLSPSTTTLLAQVNQNLWRDITAGSIVKTTQRVITPQRERILQMDIDGMQSLLGLAPLEGTLAAENTPLVLSLPLPDGGFGRFNVVESPILAPELAAGYPELRTFVAVGLDDPTATARLDLTPRGFHAMILAVDGSVFIDPYQRSDTSHYSVYHKRDYVISASRAPVETGLLHVDSPTNRAAARLLADGMIATSGPQLRTYRLVIGATGEYTQFHGGTVALALAEITTAINRVTGIYEREVSLRMVLVANTNSLIFTDGNTDPYSNNDDNAMLAEHQTQCDNVIGDANYDIGHIFSTGGGGLAGLGVACLTGQKAEGVTGSATPTGDPFWVDFVAHEMGHQWGGSHVFNGTTGSCAGANRNAATAYEPGSGSTIQCYAGICDAQDLQANSNDYFHTSSFDQIEAHIAVVGTCGTVTATGNSAPVPVAGVGGFTIPISTPFELTGSATDVNNNPMTYCWEQFDLGPAGAPGAPVGDAPILRSFAPVTSPTRVFPKLTDLLNNTTTIGELLPTYARNLTFRLTVRDNLGGVAHDQLAFAVEGTAGPFLVTAPNTAVTWTGGTSQLVSWDVANTNQAPVNCTNVELLLSVDGGLTFGTVLLASTPNDGSEMIIVPNAATTQARIKVKATNNVFFDLSNQNFTILAGGPACAISALSAGTQTACDGGTNTYTQQVTVTYANQPVAGTLDVNGQSFAIGTSPQTVVLTALPADGQPVNVTASFSAAPACTLTMNALFTAPVSCGAPACTISALTAGARTVCDGGTNTYTQQVTVTYANPPVSGTLDVNGQSFAIGTSPQLVVLTALPADSQPVNVTASFSAAPACTLTVNSLFAARASCAAQTTLVCMPEAAMAIPDDDPTGITSTISFANALQIQSVRISVDIEHTWIGDLIVEVAHNGTTVRLHNLSGNDNQDILGFYPTDLTPDGPGTLADFNGQAASGTWTITVSDSEIDEIGTLWNWCVEVTGSPTATNTEPGRGDLPTILTLYPSFPNPAVDGVTQISFSLGSPQSVGVNIYDVAGRLVRTLHRGTLGRGYHDVHWNGNDQQGHPVNPGIYFSLVHAAGTKQTRKIVVVR